MPSGSSSAKLQSYDGHHVFSGCIAWAVASITHESFHGELARSMALVLLPRGRTMTNAILQDMQKDTSATVS